ncbi:carbohydrate kinase [Halobacteriales archaeon QH_10_67_13]|nr:MAG: carbohydrate kinase [Halobacteriales archaeon QH_10_67_13]
MDQCVLVADPPARVFVAGDTTVDLHPDETVAPGSGLRWFPGGTGANVARGLALLDRPPALATRIGADPFGRAINRRLTALGIDPADRVRDDRPSPVTTPDPDADRSGDSWTAWVRDTCYGFDLPDRDVLAEVDLFHCSGTVLPPTVDGPTVATAIDAARANDTAVSFDLNGRHNQWSSPAAYADALAMPLAAAGLVFAGDHDLAVAGREPTFDGLRGLFPEYPSALAVLTRGADGERRRRRPRGRGLGAGRPRDRGPRPAARGRDRGRRGDGRLSGPVPPGRRRADGVVAR